MKNKFETFSSLKRTIYLWIIPCLLVSLLLNNFLQNSSGNEHIVGTVINTVLIVWFSISWLLLYKNQLRLVESVSVIIVSLYHIITFYDAVNKVILEAGENSLGDFIIWMPVIMMYIFVSTRRKYSLIVAFTILGLTLIPGILNAGKISAEAMDSFIQYYVATIVYIVMLYFTQYLFGVYKELAAAKRDAYTDSLTGIANRHQIDTWLEGCIENCSYSNNAFSVAFFDIDHFKAINDRYGHHVGDEALKEIVSLIEKNLGAGELFGRWGGEEFIVIIQKPEKEAVILAEGLRKVIETHEFKVVGKITSSFGIAGYKKGDTIVSLLDRADKALYTSKQLGRNKVYLHEAPAG
ncbi:GGDEF domain-containing protein [Bacillus sp. FJAT-18017]|uniref:GGDEF domain-containing protein n=1 Tax=Bacillus sp. FJAT-18017 TaxID=1705566 RepID=UPI0006AEBF3D|nr:GGDEF domain-containing protein [Bacillus sp. FJAT-18017]